MCSAVSALAFEMILSKNIAQADRLRAGDILYIKSRSSRLCEKTILGANEEVISLKFFFYKHSLAYRVSRNL